MGQRSSSARHWRLAAELKKRREAAGVSGAHVAACMGWSTTKLSRIENGLQTFRRVDVIHYLGALEIYGAATRDLLAMCPQDDDHQGYFLSREGDWLPSSLNALIFHESMATGMVLYDPMVVNGLLQTADYAQTLISRELWRDAENVERIAEVRMERKRILSRPAPARFTFFMHEQALRNLVGPSTVMHDQLLFLVLVAALHNVTLRIVPSERAEQGAFGGPFQVMTFY
ncbi:MAG TPA: helix-turn-helix transcriptional regulator, partial [Actinophytocola sp.]|nr:helix-turn-helix transcriptional regulator [Actinophytocola sp.]